jgi:hypothetical protein
VPVRATQGTFNVFASHRGEHVLAFLGVARRRVAAPYVVRDECASTEL